MTKTRFTFSIIAALAVLTLGCSEIHAQIGGNIVGGGGKTPTSTCGDSGHALSWSQSTKTYGCQAITGGSAAAGGSNTQVNYNQLGALAGITGLTSNGTVATFANNALNISGATSGTSIVNAPATGGGTLTLPPGADTIAGIAATQTLTNKTISGASNTVTNIPLSAFTNLGTTTTVLHGNAAGNPTFGAVSLSADVTGSLALSSLASQAADTIVANATAGSAAPTAVAMPACANDGAHALVYASRVFTCASITGGGGSVSITSASPNLIVSPSPITGTGTIASTTAQNAQTGTSYAIASSDAGKVVTGNNASAQSYTIVAASTTNYTAGFGFDLQGIGAGAITLTATTSVFDNGLSTLVVNKGQDAFIWSDGTNYHSAVTMPVIAASSLLGNSGGSSNYPTAVSVGTGVLTALGNNLSSAGGVTSTVASGTSALGTSAIASGACATVVTTSATGVATTDVIQAGFNGDPTAVTGYSPTVNGMLTIISYPTSNNVNFKVCNNTSASVTPGAITLNWRVAR